MPFFIGARRLSCGEPAAERVLRGSPFLGRGEERCGVLRAERPARGTRVARRNQKLDVSTARRVRETGLIALAATIRNQALPRARRFFLYPLLSEPLPVPEFENRADRRIENHPSTFRSH